MELTDPKSKIETGGEPAKGGIPDFSLVIARIERQLLAGENEEGCKRILAREDIWSRIGPELQLKWARLAQMAGDVDTALRVYSSVNRAKPTTETAWAERLELLFILNRVENVARVLAEARGVIGPEAHGRLTKTFGRTPSDVDTNDIGAALRPFGELRHRQEVLDRFLDLFSGRQDCFARQWVNKAEQRQGYVPVRRPMEPQDVEEHLSGRKTYGMYLLREDATVKTAVIDADLAKDFRHGKPGPEETDLIKRERFYLFSRIQELAAEMGLSPVIEYSGGKGYHFWFFFQAPVDAALARTALGRIVTTLAKDITAFGLEVFPKQDHLSGKGLGNLVKLPLGVHRATGKRSLFIACHHRSLEAQLDYLAQIKPSPAEGLSALERASEEEKVSVHPRWKQWADEYPELFRLESLCPPLGQVIAACRNGAAMSHREEKVVFQTVGFLPRAKRLVHYLAAFSTDYNPHMTDYRLSRLRGSPLGCKRIHSLLGFEGDMCVFKRQGDYAHPLLHLDEWQDGGPPKAEKVENLAEAIENLKGALAQMERFLR